MIELKSATPFEPAETPVELPSVAPVGLFCNEIDTGGSVADQVAIGIYKLDADVGQDRADDSGLGLLHEDEVRYRSGSGDDVFCRDTGAAGKVGRYRNGADSLRRRKRAGKIKRRHVKRGSCGRDGTIERVEDN